MNASNSWEYEAPRFMDFGANEHQMINHEDDFFDRRNDDNEFAENIQPSFDGLSYSFAETTMSPKRVPVKCKIEMQPHSATIESMDHSTPSVMTSADNNVNTNETGTECIPVQSSSEEQQSQSPHKRIPSNIMTPRRMESWKSGRPTFVVVTPSTKNIKNIPRIKSKPRRSSRNSCNSSQEELSPPKKRQRNLPKHQIPKVDMYKSKIAKDVSHKPHRRCLTSEERELEEIKKLRETAKQAKDKAKRTLDRMSSQSSSFHAPTRVTQPKEFHFKTDERAAKVHTMSTRADCSSSSDFNHELRKYHQSPVKKSKTTVVKPFHLSHDRKRKMEPEKAVPFVPMAQAIIDFHKRTPRRYKTSNRNAQIPVEKRKPMRATHPKTPQLSKPRKRPISCLSAKEQEEREVEEMKNYKFVANPVNPVILDGAEKLKKVEKKPVTVPVGFSHLHDQHKDQGVSQPKVEQPEPFKALPIPISLFEKTTGLKKKEPAPLTIPMSPAFALKSRIKLLPHTKPDLEPQPQSFYRPPPQATKVFHPKLPSTKTEPIPFSFDVADTKRFQKKEEKIMEEISKHQETQPFRAQPMPCPSSPILPPKQVKEATKPIPFQMKCEERAAIRSEENSKQQEEISMLKTSFTANKDYKKITRGKSWEPKLLHKPPTEPNDIRLHSDERARKREDYERSLKQEVSERNLVLAEEQKRLEEEEKRQVSEIRRERMFKAQEIKHFKNVEITQSKKKLTVPSSPKFSKRFNK